MIKLETLVSNGKQISHNRQNQNNYSQNHFLIQSDQPCRIELLQGKDGNFVVWVYRGFQVDTEQEPVGAFDSHNSVENHSWIAFNPIINRDISLRDIIGDELIENYIMANCNREGDMVDVDPEEIVGIAKPYLQQFGFKDIQYECHGNVPMIATKKRSVDFPRDEDIYIRVF